MPLIPKGDGQGAFVNGRFVTGEAMNEMEDVILRNEAVERCCIVPHGEAKKGRALWALILAKGGAAAGEQLMRDLKASLEGADFEEHEIPTAWRAVRWLPESPRRETVRQWLKRRVSFKKFTFPGRQAPFRGEKDWENPKLAIILTEPLNDLRFEGGLVRFNATKVYGEKAAYFDLSHKVREPHAGARRERDNLRTRTVRLLARDPDILRRVEKSDRGAHMVIRGRVLFLRAGGVHTGKMSVVLEATDLEVISDFRRTSMDSTDDVFERAL